MLPQALALSNSLKKMVLQFPSLQNRGMRLGLDLPLSLNQLLKNAAHVVKANARKSKARDPR